MSTPGSGRDASRKDDVTGLLNAHRTARAGGAVRPGKATGRCTPRSVRARFLSVYLPVIFVLTFAISGTFHLLEYRDTVSDLDSKLRRMTINYGILVAEPLAASNGDQISLILAGSTNDPDLLGIGVADTRGTVLAQIGDLSFIPRKDLHVVKPLRLASADGLRLIGELRIVLGDTRLSETIDRQIALTVVLVVATLLAALVSSLIAHRTAIGLPLARLVDHVRQIRAGEPHMKLETARRDEIGILVEAFNDLQERQGVHERQLTEARDQLDRRVKERTADLEAALDAAESANRAKNRFLANLSHELRTPLNAIIGFSELLEKGLAGDVKHPQAASHARDIKDSGQHLLEMINNLLSLSRAEAGKLVASRRPIDPGALLRAQVRMMMPLANEASVTLEEEIGDDLPQINADPHMIRQIATNLLSNAIKFTDSGGTVTITAQPEGADAIGILVIDTGIGIPPEDRERVLKPFEQAENGLSRRYEGTGLGLPIAHALVALHDGVITIEDRKGGGTVVRVQLPVSGA